MSQQKILIVDPEPAVIKVLATKLRKQNYEVVGAANAEEALNELRNQPFAALLFDMSLPESGGLQLLNAARSLYPDLVFIPMDLT